MLMIPKFKSSHGCAAKHVILSLVGIALAMISGGRLAAAETSPPVLTDKPDMTWFTDARLGIFIHWGIYSEGKGSESWAFRGGDMPYDVYTNQASTFTAANYDPEK